MYGLYLLLLWPLWLAKTQDDCTDVAPSNDYTCEQQAAFGKCEANWMLAGDFCNKTCKRCSSQCSDKQPDKRYSCGEQARFDKCNARWMLDGDYCAQTCGRCSVDVKTTQQGCDDVSILTCDVSALLELKAGMSRQAQDRLGSWIGDNPCAGWLGIRCRMAIDGEQQGLRVNRIVLGEFVWEQSFGLWNFRSNPNYVGQIATSLPLLMFTNMLFLEEINLWNSGVIGSSLPPEMSNLEDLQVLVLGENSFPGSLPQEFSGLGDLEVVEFQGMNLRGTLPVEYSNWSQLRILNVRSNYLSGSLPSDYSRWVSSSRPISLQGFFVEQFNPFSDESVCASQEQVDLFMRRAALATDINDIRTCF